MSKLRYVRSGRVFVPACLLFLAVSSLPAFSQTVIAEHPHPAPMQAERTPDGFTAHNEREMLQVTVCGDSIVHVVARTR